MEATALYENFGNAHNIVANEDTNFVYVVGATEDYPGFTCGGWFLKEISVDIFRELINSIHLRSASPLKVAYLTIIYKFADQFVDKILPTNLCLWSQIFGWWKTPVSSNQQWIIQPKISLLNCLVDPHSGGSRFSKRGCQPSSGALWYEFIKFSPKNCMKSRKIWSLGDPWICNCLVTCNIYATYFRRSNRPWRKRPCEPCFCWLLWWRRIHSWCSVYRL